MCSSDLPVGLDVVAVAPVEKGDSLQQSVTSCTWSIEVDGVDMEQMNAWAADVLARDEDAVAVRRKGIAELGQAIAEAERHAVEAPQSHWHLTQTERRLAAKHIARGTNLSRTTRHTVQNGFDRVLPNPSVGPLVLFAPLFGAFAAVFAGGARAWLGGGGGVWRQGGGGSSVWRAIGVGSGTGPETRAPVRLDGSRMSNAAWTRAS